MLIDFSHLKRKYNVNATGCLHVGAHEGQEAPHYYKIGCKKMIFIEAIPEIFLRLKSNISKYPDAIALNYCVSDKEDEVVFHVANNDGQSSSFLEFGTHKDVHPEVKFTKDLTLKTHRLDKILSVVDMRNVNFLNMDLQGAEMLALKGLGNFIDQFDYAYLEVNWKELYKGCTLFPDLVKWMKSKGFKCVEALECGNTKWGDAFFIR